jgi:hypothetical protein
MRRRINFPLPLRPPLSLHQDIDYWQRFQKGRTEEESEAEIADDVAGREVAGALRKAHKEGACSSSATRQNLKDILCR